MLKTRNIKMIALLAVLSIFLVNSINALETTKILSLNTTETVSDAYIYTNSRLDRYYSSFIQFNLKDLGIESAGDIISANLSLYREDDRVHSNSYFLISLIANQSINLSKDSYSTLYDQLEISESSYNLIKGNLGDKRYYFDITNLLKQNLNSINNKKLTIKLDDNSNSGSPNQISRFPETLWVGNIYNNYAQQFGSIESNQKLYLTIIYKEQVKNTTLLNSMSVLGNYDGVNDIFIIKINTTNIGSELGYNCKVNLINHSETWVLLSSENTLLNNLNIGESKITTYTYKSDGSEGKKGGVYAISYCDNSLPTQSNRINIPIFLITSILIAIAISFIYYKTKLKRVNKNSKKQTF